MLGVIHLKDVVKPGMAERFDRLRAMGIRTVMITGDNPLTAAAIAKEAGVDDFLAEATPEDKMALIRKEQEGGRLVAMTGDGTNDAPALAQADVGVAMNTGTSAAKEAGNMVDLDSDPTKLIEIVEIGKQLLITRGALTTFSIANDVAKYFAIIPAMFIGIFPGLAALNIMGLSTPVVGDALGGDLQRPGHRRADPVGAQGCSLPAVRRRRDAAPQPARLRARRRHHAVHRHQAHRPRRLAPSRNEVIRVSTLTRQLSAALRMLLALTLVCGVGYPLVVLGIGQAVAARQRQRLAPRATTGTSSASSSLGQQVTDPQWFQGRRSASEYAGNTSGGSNLGTNDPKQAQAVTEARDALVAANPQASGPPPADAVTASASGLDPDISPAYASWQVPRVAAARGLTTAQVQTLVDDHTKGRLLGFLGQPRVNVTELNLALAGAAG